MKLGKISPNKGSVKKTKRLGRGNATGQGRTAGKGHNGFKSRSGARGKLHYEGGQMAAAWCKKYPPISTVDIMLDMHKFDQPAPVLRYCYRCGFQF